MNFVVSSTALLNHLQSISKVISSKNTLPILDNVLFDLQGNQLVMTASDLETTVITRMDLENAKGDGIIALDAKRLMSTLRETPEQPLSFNIDVDSLAIEISTERAKFNMMGMNGIDFPVLPNLDETKTAKVQLKAEALLNGITKTIFAAANDELRPVMNGVFFQVQDGKLTMLASDSHKLVRFVRSNIPSNITSTFIMPQKPASLLKNILPKNDSESIVELEFDDKNAYFEISGFKLVCRLVEGRYPSFDAVIPQNNPNKVQIDRVEWLNALRRVSVYSNPASNLVKLEIGANEIVISAQDIDFSISATERINCVFDGDALEIGFKSLFLIEILNNINSSDVVLEMSDPSRAGLVLPAEKDNPDEDVLMLIMPMMIHS